MDEEIEAGGTEKAKAGGVVGWLRELKRQEIKTPIEKYLDTIRLSVFGNVGALTEVAQVCQGEGVAAAHSRLLTILQREQMSYLPLKARPEGITGKTAIIHGRKYIYYPDDVSDRSELRQLVDLSHKYKSLQLRAMGLREQKGEEILITDLAFFDFLESLPITTGEEKQEIDLIRNEYERRLRMIDKKRNARPRK